MACIRSFFCALIHTARNRPETQLREWWSERRCAEEWGEFVRSSLPFFVEHDNGAERLARLADKLDGYQVFADAGDPT